MINYRKKCAEMITKFIINRLQLIERTGLCKICCHRSTVGICGRFETTDDSAPVNNLLEYK